MLLHQSIFPIGKEEAYSFDEPDDSNHGGADFVDLDEMLPGLSEAPAYCFHPKDPVTEKSGPFAQWAHKHLKTKRLFNMFYILLEVTLVIVALVFTAERIGLIVR